MIFNSIDFAIFIPIVFLLYWFVFNKNLKVQNGFITIASYVFYGWWDWRFLSLIIFSTLVDFFVGGALVKVSGDKKRKILLYTSLAVNLGLLGVFKYYNFFVESFSSTFLFFNRPLSLSTLNIILPVGISFYTFQTLSYTIDVYRKKIQPTDNIVAFSSFVSFFPQLVAGPIERASNLLPQFYKKRQFDQSIAVDGMRQVLWGFFKKVVIADNCAVYANDIFNNYESLSGGTLFLGGVFFAFQIYGDFSGYSDIAIGISRLFGFNLSKNFNFPYFSRDIAEFWRKWHISLSTWFRDYLYIPLGGSKTNKSKQIRNVFIIFIVSGFWHGANWTFIIWGALNAIYFIPLLLMKKNRANQDFNPKHQITLREIFSIIMTFTLTVLAWIIFRSESIFQSIYIYEKIFSLSFIEFIIPATIFWGKKRAAFTISFVLLMIVVEWFSKHKNHVLEELEIRFNKFWRWSIYLTIILVCLLFQGTKQEFIYFQF